MADIVTVFAVKAGLNDTEPLLSMVQAMCGSDSMLTLTEEQIVVTSTGSSGAIQRRFHGVRLGTG